MSNSSTNESIMSESLYKKIGVASVIMMASVFLSRIIGFSREMVIAYIAGTDGAVDAYQVAFILPEILNHVLASGFLSVTFIPIFSIYLAQNREAEGWRAFSIIMNVFGSLLLVFIFIAVIFAPGIITILAPGLNDPVIKNHAVRMTRIILPAQFFFFTGGLFMAVQFAKERFFICALAPLVYNLGIIAGGICLGPRLGMEGFSWGVLGGSFLGNFALQYWGAQRVGMKIHAAIDLRHPQLKKYIVLTLPLMVGLTMTFSTEILFRFFGSYFPVGGIAALNYGLRTMFMLVGFLGQALGTASFPFMARLAAEGKIGELNRLLNKTLRYSALIIPLSVLVMVLRKEIIFILFQRGRFDAAATQLTSELLCFLMIGAVAFSAQTVVVRGYFAVQNTLFPALYGTCAVVISIPIYLLSMHKMGILGVALAISLSAIFQVFLLYVIWNKKTSSSGGREIYKYILKIIVLSIPLGLFLEWLRIRIAPHGYPDTFAGNMALCFGIGAVFSVLFISAGYVFRLREIFELINRIRSRTSLISKS